ncbi:MAG: hypothetical protein ACE5G0_08675 [Rhodothermales bacterium]
MSDKESTGDHISATISGNVSGQVAVGKDIAQHQTIGATDSAVTPEEKALLQQLLADLKAQIEAEAPPDKKDKALERIEELEEEVGSEKPDLTTMAYVKRWFGKNLPKLAGAVTSVIIHPIVGKLVEAAGEGLSAQLRRLIGGEEE